MMHYPDPQPAELLKLEAIESRGRARTKLAAREELSSRLASPRRSPCSFLAARRGPRLRVVAFRPDGLIDRFERTERGRLPLFAWKEKLLPFDLV